MDTTYINMVLVNQIQIQNVELINNENVIVRYTKTNNAEIPYVKWSRIKQQIGFHVKEFYGNDIIIKFVELIR